MPCLKLIEHIGSLKGYSSDLVLHFNYYKCDILNLSQRIKLQKLWIHIYVSIIQTNSILTLNPNPKDMSQCHRRHYTAIFTDYTLHVELVEWPLKLLLYIFKENINIQLIMTEFHLADSEFHTVLADWDIWIEQTSCVLLKRTFIHLQKITSNYIKCPFFK